MRNMSFSLTIQQLRDGTKTVTRRKGWQSLKAGDRVRAVEKVMGLKAGESIKPLGEIEVVSVRREPLGQIDQADVLREGFPDLTPQGFIDLFCQHQGGDADQLVTRIEFRAVPARERDSLANVHGLSPDCRVELQSIAMAAMQGSTAHLGRRRQPCVGES